MPFELYWIFEKLIRYYLQLMLIIADRFSYMIGIAEICEETLDFSSVVDINVSVSVDVACLDLKISGHIIICNVFLYHCHV